MNLIILFVITIICVPSLNGLRERKKSYSSRLNFFDTDLLRYVTEEHRGNVMVSPASVKSVLVMLLEGAEGDTALEIKSALRLSPNKDEYREQISMYLSALKANTSGTFLKNANAIFVTNSLKVKQKYIQMLRHIYLSEIFRMNFQNPELATNVINSWVSEKTRGLVPEIVDPIQINPSIDILVTNALYFKSSWKYSFDPKLTRSDCFYVDGACTKVAIMELQAELNYAYVEDLRAHALELPYEGDAYSMLLIVPQDREGCATLIRDLPYMSIPQILDLMDPTDVQLSLPRFSVDYSEDLVTALRNMRINSVFSTNANLTGIFGNEPSPQVNNIFHRTHIEVDEVGTVAAAATSAMVVPLINSGVQLEVDRPFVFFIRDNNLGATLFEGRIEEPEMMLVKHG